MKNIRIYTPIEIDSSCDGSMSFVSRDLSVLTPAKQLFGRENQDGLLVKIFHYPAYADPEQFQWGKCFSFKGLENTRSGLLETIKVQNLFAFEGLAPRVYGIFEVENDYFGTKHYALLEDDLGYATALDWTEVQKTNLEFYENLQKHPLAKDIDLPFFDVATSGNVIGGKLVDWQGAKFKPTYLESLKQRYLDLTYFGNSKYQTVPELGIEEGIRKMDIRYKDLGFDRIDLRGKKIVDVGCSGGNFLNYCKKQGAKYAVGLDFDYVIKGARELSNYLGFFNNDYFVADLKTEVPSKAMINEPYDLVIFTSMTTHVGVPSYLHTLGKFMILEINHSYQIDDTLEALKPYWDLEYIGQSTDFGDRAIYHCRNKLVN